MNPNRYLFTTLALAGLAFSGVASATPAANSIVIAERVFNDNPDSFLSTVDNDFALIVIEDLMNPAGPHGFANRHAWSFSTDNINPVDYQNGDGFSYCATVVLTGPGRGEFGLRVSPWWSPNVDGTFMLNAGGEIAVFGGRLPFYSFTANHGQTYNKGDVVTLTVTYKPNGLSAASPATIEYGLTNGNGSFTSNPLAFDEGNAAEGHGTWGALSPTRVGGYVQVEGQNGAGGLHAEWRNICYNAFPVPAENSTWGRIKADYR
jgi:hypothetical protein